MINYRTIWIVVADGARARFFRSNPGGTRIEPALDMELVADRRKSRDIDSDRPGRTKDRMAHGRHALEPSTDPHEHARQAFAREVVELLEKHRASNDFDELVVVAPPKMLGHIRDAMSAPLRQMVRREEPKDLTKLDIHQLPERLAELVQPA